MNQTNRAIILAARPEGEPNAEDFRLETRPVPEPGPGQILLRNRWLSLDPYMRGRMSAAKSYVKPYEVGEVIGGGTVAEVLTSNHPKFAAGDTVLADGGWQDYALSDGKGVRKLDPNAAPVTTALGVLGMPGLTAYTGLLNIGQPKEGETLVVAAAAGPVGSAVGQIAKLKGCRTVGIAGGADKRRHLVEELGFDVGLDHRAPDFAMQLKEACPQGIDIYFENVSGAVWDAVAPLLNTFARVPICGLAAIYNATSLPPGPDRSPALMRAILTKRLTLRGFIVSDFAAQFPDFARDMGAWVRAGQVRYREDVTEGLEHAPEAFIGMLKGRNFGKAIVKL